MGAECAELRRSHDGRMDEPTTIAPIREAVRALCADFPGEYWRKLDRERAYPAEFVAALTKAGFLAALIPEEYGGSGLNMVGGEPPSWRRSTPPAATAPPATPRCTPWAPCCGTAATRRSSSICRRSPSGELRLQAFGVTEPTSGTDTLSAAHHGDARRQRRLCDQRPEDLDLARRVFRPDAAALPHHAARRGEEAHRGPLGLPRRHARRRRASPSSRSAP